MKDTAAVAEMLEPIYEANGWLWHYGRSPTAVEIVDTIERLYKDCKRLVKDAGTPCATTTGRLMVSASREHDDPIDFQLSLILPWGEWSES